MPKQIHSYCALCISKCGCIATVDDGRLIKVNKDPTHPTGQAFCLKGKAAPELVYHPERLLKPLKRINSKDAAEPQWQTISWQQALTEIQEKLQSIKTESGPEAVCWGITTPSATAISDSFMWIHRLAHSFGSPNKLFATENCNWHKDFSLSYTHGKGLGMPDYSNSDCILLWGFNPASNWIAQASLIKQAQKRGANLVVIDPRKAGLAKTADLWLDLKPGSDGLLANTLAAELIEQNSFDSDFVKCWTNGCFLVREDNGEFLRAQQLSPDQAPISSSNSQSEQQDYLAWDEEKDCLVHHSNNSSDNKNLHNNAKSLALFGEFTLTMKDGQRVFCRPAFSHYYEECRRFTLEQVSLASGLSESQIRELAQLIGRSQKLSYFSWTGTAQHQNATQTTRALACLYSLKGCIDKKGGNVYFSKAKTKDLMGFNLLGKEQLSKALGQQPKMKAQGLATPADKGWVNSNDLYQSVLTAKPYRTRALIAFGGNPIATKADLGRTKALLSALEYYVHIDLFLNDSAKHADLILPACSAWEREGLSVGFQTDQQSESHIQLRPQLVPPQGESKSDTAIVFALAKALGLKHDFFNGDIEQAIDAHLETTGLSLYDLRAKPQGINRQLHSHYQSYKDQGFATATGKIELYSEALFKAANTACPRFDLTPHEKTTRYPISLSSAKHSAHCHSQHKQIASLNKSANKPIAELHCDLARSLSINSGDSLLIETALGSVQAQALVSQDIAANTVCMQYGWQDPKYNYNALVTHEQVDRFCSSSAFKSQYCTVKKMRASTES
ncbi:molybdopterin-dependent oxidoreductase [Agaribacterium sp. ZY112]|uniref:molybdopterin-containing oxidoreductase family protein n=1 Tax=Agaribacterium sp. ZY112 TaxID=3233574 RepID=UPI003523AD90